jgi:RNA polymerase sigma factor (sigma-70 family)
MSSIPSRAIRVRRRGRAPAGAAQHEPRTGSTEIARGSTVATTPEASERFATWAGILFCTSHYVVSHSGAVTRQVTRSAGDSLYVAGDRLQRDREALLAEVIAGRESSDPELREAARRAWRRLVALEHDRVRAMVTLFRFPDRPGVRIPREHVDDVSQEVFARILGMLDGFRGMTPQQLSAAIATATRFTCMDWCRRELGRERRGAGSLDPTAEGSGSLGPSEIEIARLSSLEHYDQLAAREELESLATALRDLPSDQQREVVRLTAIGYDSEEIAKHLGLSRVNVNQLRSRALRRIREHRDD